MAMATAMATAMAMGVATKTAMAVTSAAAGSCCHGGNGFTICYAIFPQYADIVDVGNNNNCNRAPTQSTIDQGNFYWGVADFNNGLRPVWGGKG
jgi:hypothetical protein